jgi:hypothetical protein
MEPKAEELWRLYFCRASSGWAEAITPEMYAAILRYQPIPVPVDLIKIGKKVFSNTGNYDVNSVAEHIDDPKKCIHNPFVTQMMKDIKKSDVTWISRVIKPRTKNYDSVIKIIDDGATEIQDTHTCYSPNEVLNIVDAIMGL